VANQAPAVAQDGPVATPAQACLKDIGSFTHLKSSGWLRSGEPDRQDRAIAA
jgi:hypothetical protein